MLVVFSPIFVVVTKIIYGYNFVALLKIISINMVTILMMSAKNGSSRAS